MDVKVYVDGSATGGNPSEHCGVGVVVEVDGVVVREVAGNVGPGTSNTAEYKALIVGLDEVLGLGLKEAACYSDSALLVNQIHGRWRIKEPALRALFGEAQDRIHGLEAFSLSQISRIQNRHADQLASRGGRLPAGSFSSEFEFEAQDKPPERDRIGEDLRAVRWVWDDLQRRMVEEGDLVRIGVLKQAAALLKQIYGL